MSERRIEKLEKQIDLLNEEILELNSEIYDQKDDIRILEEANEELNDMNYSLTNEHRIGELPCENQNQELMIDQLREHWGKIELKHIDEMISKL